MNTKINDKMYKKNTIIEFLNVYYIDISYYLTDFYEKLWLDGKLNLEKLNKLPSNELVEYIDYERLYTDEHLGGVKNSN